MTVARKGTETGLQSGSFAFFELIPGAHGGLAIQIRFLPCWMRLGGSALMADTVRLGWTLK